MLELIFVNSSFKLSSFSFSPFIIFSGALFIKFSLESFLSIPFNKSSIFIFLFINCIFSFSKSTNPFSYFTQVCWYAFIRRIGKEKRQIEICDKIISKSGYDAFFEGDQMGSFSDYNSIRDSVDQRRKGNK